MAFKTKPRIKPVFDDSGFLTNREAMEKREKEILTKIVKEFAPDKLSLAEPVIESIAFQTAECVQLESRIRIVGPVEEYQNGKEQFGKKVSSESQVYNNMKKTLLSDRKQLLDIIGKVEKKEDQDELMAFLSRR